MFVLLVVFAAAAIGLQQERSFTCAECTMCESLSSTLKGFGPCLFVFVFLPSDASSDAKKHAFDSVRWRIVPDCALSCQVAEAAKT